MNKFFHTNLILLFILLLGLLLRFFQLGNNPPSLDWDEASLGYNAYSILKTGADEYGNKFPLSIRSFDDYKPPAYVYLAIPSIALFGLTEFAVRLPSALLGTLSIIFVYLLVLEVSSSFHQKNKNWIALTASFFFAISPWSLQFSRAAFEGNVGLFFLLIGLYSLVRALHKSVFYYLATIAFVCAMYSYHSFRLLIPLIVICFTIFFWKKIIASFKVALFAFLLLLFLCLPIFGSFLQSNGSSSRLSMVSLFNSEDIVKKSIHNIEIDQKQNNTIGLFFHNRRFVFAQAIFAGYLDHFNPIFLFVSGDGGRQHHATDMGMLYAWDIIFIFGGLYFCFRYFSKEIGFLILIFLLSPLPSSITTGTPHPVRAIAMMPFLHIFAAVGFVLLLQKTQEFKNKFFANIFVVGSLLFLVINIFYYFNQYYVITPIQYGYFWQYGNKEAVQFAKNNEMKYDKIIMSYKYDQPYIYYLFYNKIDPAWYQKNWDYLGTRQVERMKRVIGKYEFRNIDYTKDSTLKNVLLIGTPSEISGSERVLKTIQYLDGSIAYKIVAP